MTEVKKETVFGYKIVDKNLRAMNGFQYTVGETATASGDLDAMANGLHFCCNPELCYPHVAAYQLPLRYLLVSPRSEVQTKYDIAATLNLHVDREIGRSDWVNMLHNLRGREDNIDAINSIIYAAACEGDQPLVDRCIGLGATEISEAVVGAAQFGNLELVRHIVNKSDTDTDGAGNISLDLALYAAVGFGSEDLVIFLIEKGASDFNTGLESAAARGNIPMLEFMAESGATHFRHAMHDAINNSQIPAIRWLMKRGVVLTGDHLSRAATTGHSETIHEILHSETKFTKHALNEALEYAAWNNHVAAMESLIVAGADAFHSALRSAQSKKATNAIEFIIKHISITELTSKA